MLCCCARIDLGFFSLFHCVIRWPVLCHYGAQAWVEAAGEQGSALSLSLSKILLRMSPSVFLSICLCLFIRLYFCLLFLFFPSHFNSRSAHANAEMQILSPGSGLKCSAVSPFLHVLLFPAVKPAVFFLLKPMR